MDDKAARAHLLSQPEAWEDYPFGPDVAVFKIHKKVFDAVIPGCHMNKTHWNTVILDGSIPARQRRFVSLSLLRASQQTRRQVWNHHRY